MCIPAGLLDTDVYVSYLRQMTPIYQGTENRILFINSSELCAGEGNLLPSTATYQISTKEEAAEGAADGAAGAVMGSLTLVAAWSVVVVVVGCVRETL